MVFGWRVGSKNFFHYSLLDVFHLSKSIFVLSYIKSRISHVFYTHGRSTNYISLNKTRPLSRSVVLMTLTSSFPGAKWKRFFLLLFTRSSSSSSLDPDALLPCCCWKKKEMTRDFNRTPEMESAEKDPDGRDGRTR